MLMGDLENLLALLYQLKREERLGFMDKDIIDRAIAIISTITMKRQLGKETVHD